MSMLETYQGSYELLADSSVDVTIFDGSSTGYTYLWSDFSRTAFLVEPTLGTKLVGTECNGIEIIAAGLASANNDDGAFRLYGRTENGPAEYLADISMTVGTARYYNDASTSLYVDTFVIAEQAHLTNIAVKDTANDRISKLQLDFAGYRYITAELYDVSSAEWKIFFRVY